MFDPNGIRLADGQKPIIDQVANGLYVVRNTYSGNYEYFSGRSHVTVEPPSKIKGTNMPLTGGELLQFIKENAGVSGKQLAEQAGYTTTTNTGQVRVKMLAFQNAVLSANKINFKDTPSESVGGRRGRKASYLIQRKAMETS
jgi:hypothetical protein